MPVSHIGLTVSHLPTSCSFFLAALQPLGYRFIGQQGSQIGLGINDADFFICQETPGVKAGAAHIAFSAPSRTAVRDFYTAALNAGGRPNGSPACRNEDNGHFNAAVMDYDGNSIEVVYREDGQDQEGRSVVGPSRVLTWREIVAESQRDDRSVVSGASQRSMNQRVLTAAPASVAPSSIAPSTVVPASVAPSQRAPSVASKVTSVVRSVSDPVAVTQATQSIQQAAQTIQQTTTSSSGEDTAKKIIGTLLGAAAGAAVAYAMCKGEEDSVKAEKEFNAFQASQSGQPRLAIQDPRPIYESSPNPVHRNISDTESYYSTPRQAYTQRAIEEAPRNYHSPTYASVPPTQVPEQQYEYVAASAVGPRSQFTANRSVSVSGPSAVQNSPGKSRAPSSFISSLHQSEVIQGGGAIPSEIMRAVAPSDYSQRTVTKSQAKSSYTSAGKSHSPSKAPSAAPSAGPAGSIVGSVLGRDYSSESGRIIDVDAETVAPSDSISQIGSSRRTHVSAASVARSAATKHTEKHSEANSTVSKHTSASKHSSTSKHTSASKHSEANSSASRHSKHSTSSKHSHKSSRTSSRHDSDDDNVVRPSAMSEVSDASTVKPTKRKDSVVGTGGTNGQGGWGTVVSLPVRGITPSMVEESTGAKKRSVVSYAK